MRECIKQDSKISDATEAQRNTIQPQRRRDTEEKRTDGSDKFRICRRSQNSAKSQPGFWNSNKTKT